MTSQINPQQSYFYSKVMNGIQQGVGIMFLQTPAVTAFNRISVVSCCYNLSTAESIRQIYQGSIDGQKNASIKHFMRGVSGHLIKETARVGFKSCGLVMKPSLDQFFKDSPFGQVKSDLIFSGSLSVAEALINPADTLRTMWQAGESFAAIPKRKVLSHLYKGAAANATRQFGIWLQFPFSERYWSRIFKDYTLIDPNSPLGIVLKSAPQAVQISSPVWIFERLKNELQYHPSSIKPKTRYGYAWKTIVQNQGYKGFMRGFVSKVGTYYVLVIGANYMLQLGKKQTTIKSQTVSE